MDLTLLPLVPGVPINRAAPLDLLSALVETDWYAHPVNLVVRRPALGALHIRRGDTIAQVFFVDRTARRSKLQVLERGAPQAQAMREELRQWFLAHHADRSTYRKLARSRQGRLEPPEA